MPRNGPRELLYFDGEDVAFLLQTDGPFNRGRAE